MLVLLFSGFEVQCLPHIISAAILTGVIVALVIIVLVILLLLLRVVALVAVAVLSVVLAVVLVRLVAVVVAALAVLLIGVKDLRVIDILGALCHLLVILSMATSTILGRFGIISQSLRNVSDVSYARKLDVLT